jgi:hypothetical protein
MRQTGRSLSFVIGLLCAFLMQMGDVRGAVRMGTHGIRLHHEWEKSVEANEWEDWKNSFATSDANGDGRIRLSEVVNVYRDHFNHLYHNEMDHKTKSRHSVAEKSHFDEEARDFVKFVKKQREMEASLEGDSPAAERRRRRATQEENKPLHKSKSRREYVHRKARQLVETHELSDEGAQKAHDHKKETEQTISFAEFKTAMHKYMESKEGDRRSLLDMAKHIF